MSDEVGCLQVGKQADLILADLKTLNLSPVLETPIRNIVCNLVYAASGCEVKAVTVAGKVLVCNSVVLTTGENAIRAETQKQAEVVAQGVAADPLNRGMLLMGAMQKGSL